MAETVTVLRDDLATLMSITAAGQWNRIDHPEIAEAWHRLTEAKDADLEAREAAQDAPLPPGRWGRVELPGYRQHTGWITEETRFGVQMAIVRDFDGIEEAAVAVGPGSQVVFLPTPLRRPEAALTALPAGSYEGYYAEEGDGDTGGPRDCDCGPGERCFECATDDEAAAAIPPRTEPGSPF